MESEELSKYTIKLAFEEELDFTKRNFFLSSSIYDLDAQKEVFKELLKDLFKRQPEFKDVVREVFEQIEEPSNAEIIEEDSE